MLPVFGYGSRVTHAAVRADAVRNRDGLIAAARAVFGERGLDAPLDEIARRADLGNATLYRHFPSRCALVAAVFAQALGDVVAAAEQSLAEPDPWAGFAGHLRTLCSLQASDRAVADLLTATISGAPELEGLRARSLDVTTGLIARAQDAGVLRPDFRHEDVVLILMANAGLLERTGPAGCQAWQRHLDYVLDGLRRTGDGTRDASPSPGPEAVLAAMERAAHRFGVAHG